MSQPPRSSSPPSSLKNARIAEFLDDLERDSINRREDFLRSIAERRKAVERFQRLRDEVVLPAFRAVRNELARRKHVTKVLDRRDLVILSIGVHQIYSRQGTLHFVRLEDEPDKVRLVFDGLHLFHHETEIDISRVDRDMVTRAALRLVEVLLKD